jgi:hypothetical protein
MQKEKQKCPRYSSKMVFPMMDNGWMDLEKVTESKFGLMVQNTWENGKTIRQMEMVSSTTQTEMLMMDSGWMIRLVE